MFPLLIINRHIATVEKQFSDKGAIVFRIRTPEDLKEGVLQFSNIINTDRMLVFSDLFLARGNTNRLLKFIEEVRTDFVAISSVDALDGIIMSRFKTVHKYPEATVNQEDKVIEDLDDKPSFRRKMEAMIRSYPTSLKTDYYLRRCRLPVRNEIGSLILND